MNQQPNSPPVRDLPTTSLYLQDALRTEFPGIDWEACRAGPFSFRFGDRLVVIRYATPAEVELARTIRNSGGRVIYLIDDDLEAIVADPQLPDEYRSRIDAFLSEIWRDLREFVDEVLVTSEALSEKFHRYGFLNVTTLDPYWPIPGEAISADMNPGNQVEIAWLCTRSHIADLESISDDLARFLSGKCRARLTVFLGKKHPAWIRRTPRVEILNPLSWPAYRRWLQNRRIDIALYPLLDTEVNRSRSINKFLEHAVAGAASIISKTAPFADRIKSGECLFTGPDGWHDNLESLLADRSRISEIAHRSRGRAREIAETARCRQIEFWKGRLPALESRDLSNGVRL